MANDPLIFNTDGMRAIANQITSQANQSLNDHNLSWNRLQERRGLLPCTWLGAPGGCIVVVGNADSQAPDEEWEE